MNYFFLLESYLWSNILMKHSIFILRIIHGIITVYFIFCLTYVYYCAINKKLDVLLGIAVISLITEGILLYFFNNGDCPLIHIQRKIGDDKPFFSLFMPRKMAKLAIPFFSILTFLGLVFLLIRIYK